MKLSQARFIPFILVVLFASSGCGVINRIRAKNELNEAARSYRAGKFVEAQQHSERALELDPNQKTAPSFIARSIHAQYRPGVETPENTEKARRAIEAYQKLLAEDPNNEEAYKAIAALYGAIKEDDKQRQWIMQRASSESVPAAKRAEALVVLASKDWNCSYEITEQPDNKSTVMKDGKALIVLKKPKSQEDFDKAQQCVTEGLRLAEQATSLDPNNESAWSFKTNLLLEAAKLAEMDGNTEKKAEYTRQADEAQKRTTQLSEENQRRKEEEAKQSPSPPSS